MKTIKSINLTSLWILLCISMTACNDKHLTSKSSNSNKQPQANESIRQALDIQLATLINKHKLSGIPKANRSIPDIDSPVAQLGMKLFYSKSLGGDNTTACASCHHPMLGGGDNLSLSIGIDSVDPNILGIQRKLKNKQYVQVPRNAPTTFNLAFWNKVLFHDMRIKRLDKYNIHTPDMTYPESDPLAGDTLAQAQARFPTTSPDEMRNDYLNKSHNQTLRRALATRLKENWIEEFRHGFSFPGGSAEDLITEQNYSMAIAAYERSQVFIETPWKAYVEGNNNAISESAKAGAVLFYTPHEKGGAGCVSCHSGDFFTDELAHNTAMPQIGSGKSNGKTGNNDYGCELVTKKESDKFKFRTPTLLNVEVTGPWGHDGAYTSLEGITRHMLSPLASAKNYQPSQLTQSQIDISNVKENTQEAINKGIDLKPKPSVTETDIKNLVSFLKTLTDPCVKDRVCLSKWIPNSNDNDPDNLMLHAINAKTGKIL